MTPSLHLRPTAAARRLSAAMFDRRTLLLASAAVLVAACGDPAGPGQESEARFVPLGRACSESSPVFDIPAAARDSLVEHSDAHADKVWAEVARRVPGGWGGQFRVDGVATMYLVDVDRRDEAIDALRDEGIAAATGVLEGRWDFAQLYDWSRYLALHLDPTTGRIVTRDIDEARNRIEYGVDSEVVIAELGLLATELDVPCNLVAAKVEPPLSALE